MHNLHQFTVPGGLFILTLVLGFWLSRLGKPYNGVLFNIHKLIALGAVVLSGIQTIKLLRGIEASALMITLFVVAALCVIALFVSGAMMSVGKLNDVIMLSIHRIASVLLVLCFVLALFFL